MKTLFVADMLYFNAYADKEVMNLSMMIEIYTNILEKSNKFK